MKRSEQARMLIGLTIPGTGSVAGPVTAPPAEVPVARPRWLDVRGMVTRVQSWSRRHGLEGSNVACSFGLLVCGILFGLFVGGFVGFIETTTPPADSPYGLSQPATSDGQWAAMMRRYRSASHHRFEPAAESVKESSWRHLTVGATMGHVLQPGLRAHSRNVAPKLVDGAAVD